MVWNDDVMTQRDKDAGRLIAFCLGKDALSHTIKEAVRLKVGIAEVVSYSLASGLARSYGGSAEDHEEAVALLLSAAIAGQDDLPFSGGV